MKIAIISHLKFPIAKPFAGGLEAFTHEFVSSLQRRGHDVTLFAAGDSDAALPLEPVIPESTVSLSDKRLGTISHEWIESVEDEAYAQLMMRLCETRFDVIHNHTLSPIPLRFASLLTSPLVTTLHSPCLPRIETEVQSIPTESVGCVLNISKANRRSWDHVIPNQRVIYNGIDTEFWGGDCPAKQRRVVWYGRICPDKGTHYAIRAAHRVGLPIDVVGPVADEGYFRRDVLPGLMKSDRYHGHQSPVELRRIVSRASVAIATPCWDEPFGLVVPEALACGTPVAAFARGALPEILGPSVGRLARPSSVDSLANAIRQCLHLRGDICRRYAEAQFGLDRMISEHEKVYQELVCDSPVRLLPTPLTEASANPSAPGAQVL